MAARVGSAKVKATLALTVPLGGDTPRFPERRRAARSCRSSPSDRIAATADPVKRRIALSTMASKTGCASAERLKT